MLCVGIDVAKRKHDCCIIDSDALKTVESFTFPNSREGFDMLLSKISELGIPKDKIRVGLEATGHYSSNLAHFISEHDLPLNIFRFYNKCWGLVDTPVHKTPCLTIK